MRLEQIQAFLTVAETGSFQQAAKRCDVTQSTISRQVQTLETILGVSLFHRTSHVKLTIAGECFMPRARKILNEWTLATTELKDLMDGKQLELCIAAIHSVCAYQLPPVLQRFCAEYPQVQLRVTSLGSDRALKVLKDGLVDLAIVMNNRFLTASPEMIVDKLYTEPVQVLMSARTRLLSRIRFFLRVSSRMSRSIFSPRTRRSHHSISNSAARSTALCFLPARRDR